MNETRIDEIRKSKGWTQERLAEESGIAVRTIQRLESGQDASLATLTAVANALEVPVRDLFGEVEKPAFASAVDDLDERRTQQQTRRDATERSAERLFTGLGVLVIFGTLILATATPVGWYVWLIIPAYWVAGRALFRFIMTTAVEPKLDARYPLSRPAESGRDRDRR